MPARPIHIATERERETAVALSHVEAEEESCGGVRWQEEAKKVLAHNGSFPHARFPHHHYVCILWVEGRDMSNTNPHSNQWLWRRPTYSSKCHCWAGRRDKHHLRRCRATSQWGAEFEEETLRQNREKGLNFHIIVPI